MIFRQVIHDDLGCASYLVGDERAGVAAVVDPRLEIEEYLGLARYLGVAIEHILETHTHADHVSGHGRLVAATGARVHVHRLAAASYDHEPFEHDAEWALGDVRIRALHTPGHRPEHTAFLLFDGARGERPWAVLTGDTLFVGDVARADLAIDARAGAHGIFRSLRERLLTLPDEVEVWPGHLGGSLCGGPTMDMKVCSTIGFERAHNPALAFDDEERFVAASLAALGPQPPNFTAIVELNRGPFVTDAVVSPPRSPNELAVSAAAGALVVDVRTDEQFDDAHVPGAVPIPLLRAGFGTRLAWLAVPGREILLVGRDDEDGRRAAWLAAAVGVRTSGHLAGGMTSWRQERRPVARVERLAAADLAARLEADEALQVVDVREPGEWAGGSIPGAVRVSWRKLVALPAEIDPARPVAAVCGSGQRAAIAAGLLQRAGARHVVHVVDGGVGTWAALGCPLEISAAA